MAHKTVRELKKVLADTNATWTVHPNLTDPEKIPRHALGGIREQMRVATEVPAIDFKQVLGDFPGNPFVYQRRVDRTILQPDPQIIIEPNFVGQLTRKPFTLGRESEPTDVHREDEAHD